MKKLLRNSLLASAVAVSVFGVASQAKAGTADVPFDGSIAGSCTFDSPTAGTLVAASDPNFIEASSGVQYNTASKGGATGKISITCVGNSQLTISDPVPVSADAVNVNPSTAKAAYFKVVNGTTLYPSPNAKSGNWFSLGSSPNSSLSIGSGTTNLEVGMSSRLITNTSEPFPNGSYTYKVTVTSTL